MKKISKEFVVRTQIVMAATEALGNFISLFWDQILSNLSVYW